MPASGSLMFCVMIYECMHASSQYMMLLINDIEVPF